MSISVVFQNPEVTRAMLVHSSENVGESVVISPEIDRGKS